jgi:hypothetical protein
LSGRRRVDSSTLGRRDACERRGVDLTPKASTRVLRNGWRDLDGITVAKNCVALLITVLILALLAVVALAILTDRFETSRKSGFAATQTPIAELRLTR